MARKRMIDPSIWTDEGMAELTPRQQLCYIGLFSNADDDGRLKGSPAAVALMLPTVYGGTPRDDVAADIRAVVGVMRCIVRYLVNGREYLAFANFRRWQRIDKPTPSILPAPPDDSTTAPVPVVEIPVAFDDDSPSAPVGVPPSIREEKLTEEKRTEEKTTRPARAAPPPPVGSPYALLESLCETLGQDVAVLSEGEKKKQLAAGKRLVAAGVGESDVRRITRWLASQAWVTGGIDLFLLEKQLGKWQLAGKPEAVSQNGRASPVAAKTSDDGGMAEWRAMGQREVMT